MVALDVMLSMTGNWEARGLSLVPGGFAGATTLLGAMASTAEVGGGTSREVAIPPMSITVTGWREGEKQFSSALLDREELEMLSKAAPTVVVCSRGRAKVTLPMETSEDNVDVTELLTASVQPPPSTTDEGCSKDEGMVLYIFPLRVVAEMVHSSCSDTGASEPVGIT